tara:strand:- start:101 stop:400 length:300 start_codon:yes stop_codon:yes gene_type:complete
MFPIKCIEYIKNVCTNLELSVDDVVVPWVNPEDADDICFYIKAEYAEHFTVADIATTCSGSQWYAKECKPRAEDLERKLFKPSIKIAKGLSALALMQGK